MAAFTTGFLASLVANGLTTFIMYLGRQSVKDLQAQRNLLQTIARDAPLVTILQKASTKVAKGLSGSDPKILETLKFFMASPDVDAIVRQIYAFNLSSGTKENWMESIRDEFESCLKLHLSRTQTELAPIADSLFRMLVDGCERALGVAIDNGFLAAHEAKSAARTRLILDELAAIKAKLNFLSREEHSNIQEIEQYESKLRQQIADRHSYIVPPHFDTRRRIPVDELYVIPNLVSSERSKKPLEKREFTLDLLMSFLYRAVLLGNPGSGKSTLATKICHDLALHYADRPLGGRRVTPLLIILRDYGRAKKERGTSILQFIEELSNSTYQVSPPKNGVEYLLSSGRFFVIFDGLDELLDTSYRQQVSEDVESFSTLYPSVPMLVTSREVGYEQAPLNEQVFEILSIASFDEHQIADYVGKWFATDKELTKPQQKEKAEAFLKESRAVPDLRTNPLMLALMCNIYRGENYIPRNRPDVYEKCAVMLFEKWDKARGIRVPLPFEVHIRPAMMYLAYWIYGDEALQGGVTENALIEKSTEYLYPRRYEDSYEARKAASDFIDFCRGRAWVFTDTGTTAEGDRLYQFTHRTFLEYFAAAYIVRTNPTPKQLIRMLTSRIAAREWDVVSQLACQIQYKQTEGAGDALLGSIIGAAGSKTRKAKTQGNLYSFACRTLEFLIPSPSLARQVVARSIKFCIEWGRTRLDGAQTPHSSYHRGRLEQPYEIVSSILNVAKENRNPVAKELETVLTDFLTHGDTDSRIVTLQLALNLPSFLFRGWFGYEYEYDSQLHDFWQKLGTNILSNCSDGVETICRLNHSTCLSALLGDNIELEKMVQWHGVRSLFLGSELVLSAHIGVPPIIPFVVLRLLEMKAERSKDAKGLADKWNAILAKAASILTHTEPPWVNQKDFLTFNERWDDLAFLTHSELNAKSFRKADADLAFLIFISSALHFELVSNKDQFIKKLSQSKRKPWHIFQAFRHALRARAGLSQEGSALKEVTKYGLSDPQTELVRSWINGKVSFVI